MYLSFADKILKPAFIMCVLLTIFRVRRHHWRPSSGGWLHGRLHGRGRHPHHRNRGGWGAVRVVGARLLVWYVVLRSGGRGDSNRIAHASVSSWDKTLFRRDITLFIEVYHILCYFLYFSFYQTPLPLVQVLQSSSRATA